MHGWAYVQSLLIAGELEGGLNRANLILAARPLDTNNPFQTSQNIAREDVGVTLRVTPQISEGDTVRLNIFQEISEVDESPPMKALPRHCGNSLPL